MFLGAHSVMFFVHDVRQALDWYADFLGTQPVLRAPDFYVLPVSGVDICFHQADRKVSSGACGSVLYWQVEDFDAALWRATRRGGRLHRGPLPIESGNAIAQVLDPFGNLFGLVGPLSPGQERDP